MMKAADPAKYKPAAGANYPRGRFGESLKQLCQLIKADLGVQVAFADIGGWDHHVNEGSTQGQIANVLRDFSQSLGAFWTDLGDLAEDTVVVTMSEFGRTARENGNRGTDHGHANAMFVMGGPVKGGKVYGRWPGLDQSQLYEGRDLAVTTDFRRVLGEAVERHLGNKALDQVFPGFDNQPGKFVRTTWDKCGRERPRSCGSVGRTHERDVRGYISHHYVATFHFQRIDCNSRSRIVACLAGLRVPLPAVPGTDHLASLNHALSQRTALMQADVVHGGDGAVDVGDTDDFVTKRKFLGFAYRRKFGLSCKSYEVGHGTFQSDESELPSFARPDSRGRLSPRGPARRLTTILAARSARSSPGV